MNKFEPKPAHASMSLSRRGFLIAGSTAAITAWLTTHEKTATAAPAPAATTSVEHTHRTLLGVL
ncbi:hypothetical protein [Rhodoglobus aureus]|uniref:Uncharacterized protein n=1 Tax=Rhodoglobus aureus TaxID=191497 RepID=A0ABP4G036_9MICO